jgi:hypothetical protein
MHSAEQRCVAARWCAAAVSDSAGAGTFSRACRPEHTDTDRSMRRQEHAFGRAAVCSSAVVRTDKSMHSAERWGAAAVSDCAGAGRCRCLGQTEHTFSRAAARASEVADCAGAGRCRCAAGTSRTWWSRRTACPSPTTPPRLCKYHVCAHVYMIRAHMYTCKSLHKPPPATTPPWLCTCT